VTDNPYKFDKGRREEYLQKLRAGVRRSAAARAVGVDRTTVWRAIRDDPDFAAAVDEAELDAAELVEDALFQAALKGHVRAQQVWLYNRCSDRWGNPRALAKMDPVEAFLHSLSPEMREAALGLLGRQDESGANHPGPTSGEAAGMEA
jgi:hypothetical protein